MGRVFGVFVGGGRGLDLYIFLSGISWNVMSFGVFRMCFFWLEVYRFGLNFESLVEFLFRVRFLWFVFRLVIFGVLIV